MDIKAFVERYCGFIIAITLTSVAFIFRCHIYDGDKFPKLLDGVLTYASITTGFLGILLSIFISIVDKEQIRTAVQRLSKSEYGLKYFLRYMRRPFFTGIILIFLSFICIYVENIILQLMWIFVLTLYSCMLVRICDILFSLFEKLLQTNN